jgi:hypothetical protein
MAFAAFVLAAALVTPAPPEPDPPKIHACTLADGGVVYTSDSCEELAPPRKARAAVPAPKTVAPKPAVAPTPASPKPAAPRWIPLKPATAPTVVLPLEDDEEEIPEPPGPADPRLGSPQLTWKTFLGAMRSGDRALASACLTSSALTEHGPTLASLPLESLRLRADALPEIKLGGMAGPFRVATSRGSGDRPKWIFFEKNRKGEWRIAAL